MDDYPFVVLVPRTLADETTMGEWLESRNIDYVDSTRYPARAAIFRFQFASKSAADAFAANFIGMPRSLVG